MCPGRASTTTPPQAFDYELQAAVEASTCASSSLFDLCYKYICYCGIWVFYPLGACCAFGQSINQSVSHQSITRTRSGCTLTVCVLVCALFAPPPPPPPHTHICRYEVAYAPLPPPPHTHANTHAHSRTRPRYSPDAIGHWSEVLDPASGFVYWCNVVSGERVWDAEFRARCAPPQPCGGACSCVGVFFV